MSTPLVPIYETFTADYTSQIHYAHSEPYGLRLPLGRVASDGRARATRDDKIERTSEVAWMTTRWLYRNNGKEFIAYDKTKEGAIDRFASVLGTRPGDDEVARLPDSMDQAQLVVDDRRAPGS